MSIKIPDQIENILINIHNVGDGEHTYDHQSGIGPKYGDGEVDLWPVPRPLNGLNIPHLNMAVQNNQRA